MFYRLRILSLKTRILYTIVLEKFKSMFGGKGRQQLLVMELFSSEKGGRCVFSARRFRSIRTTTLFVELLRGSPPLLGAELFLFFFFNCVGWNHVGILSRLACFARWNLCGLFSLSFSSSFFLFFSAESSASKKISSFRSRCSHEPTFHFSRVFRERNFRVTLTIFQHP